MSVLLSSKHDCTIYFVNELHPRYSCGICLHIADKPLSCGSKDGCMGLFCTKCLTLSLATNKTCPICTFIINESPQKNNIIKDMIADEHVYCSFVRLPQDENPSKKAKTQIFPRRDCQWTGPLKDLDAHLTHNCEFAPTACINEGYLITPLRGQLATHRDTECLYRLKACAVCSCLIPVIDSVTHTATCGNVLLPCPDCDASYLREDEAAHELACLEKPVTCPFACHGCSTVVLRRHADQHQIDCAIKHSELLATAMNTMRKELATLQQSHEAIACYSWTMVVNKSAPYTTISKDFTLPHHPLDQDSSIMYLSCKYNYKTKIISISLCKRHDYPLNKNPINIITSNITLQNPTDTTKHVTHTYYDTNVIDTPHSHTGYTTNDVTPYLSLADTITIKLKFKYSINDNYIVL